MRRIAAAFALGLMACARDEGGGVAGCYEPAIGPYAGPFIADPGPRFSPAWVRLEAARDTGGTGNAVGTPPGFAFGIPTRGVWHALGEDSVLVAWGSQHAGATFRLAVERDGLRGTGATGGGTRGGPVWPVVARRVPCR